VDLDTIEIGKHELLFALPHQIQEYPAAARVGVTMESSSEPLTDPWYLHSHSSLARSLGFQPAVRAVCQAVQEKLL